MTKNNSQPPETSWGSDDSKSWWSRRSKLERKLLISLGITLVFVLGFVIYVGIKPKVSAASDGCSTPGCLQAAAQIITHIDTDIDPCEDFFKFACGKFIEHIHGDIKAASIQSVEDQVERQLAEILKEPINDDDPYVMRLEKETFQACMNETAVEEESLGIFKEHLKELKGWPVVIKYKWRENLFHWTDTVVNLRRMGYPYRMMLDVRTTYDPNDLNQYIVFISEPGVPSIKEEHKELYKKYMTEVAVIFGADRHRASIEMEKVLDFRERLKKVALKNTWDVDNETDTNYTAKLLERRFKVEDFEDYDDEIDWLEFINALMYPMGNISSDDYVIFPSDDFLEEFFTLIYKTPKKTQANYIIWSVLENLMPFLTKELKQLEGNYTCLTQEDSSIPADRFDYCKRILNGNFLPEPTNIIYARKYLPPEKREMVQELLGNVKSEFKTLLTENSWMDDETKEKAGEKADALVEIIGAPGDYFDDAVFERYQMINYTEGDGFLVMVLNRSKHENDVMFSLIHSTTNDSSENIFYDLTTRVNAMYSPYDNTIILPAGILQGVFFNPDRPMYLNYGAIGSIIGHELTHGFTKDSSKFDKDGKESDMWSEETENAYDEIKQCIIKDAEDFDVEDTEQTINGTLTLEENVADFAGIKASYAAYRSWVEENGEEPQLPGIEYTPYQLFWISAISYECYKLSGERLEKGLERDSHAHNAFRATAPMRNNENFAIDFNCPADSKMNPPEKCQVF